MNGSTGDLRPRTRHPYIGRAAVPCPPEILQDLNKGRDIILGEHVESVYYYEVLCDKPFAGLKEAAKMLLEHGTVKPWHREGDDRFTKPDFYDANMSWMKSMEQIEYDPSCGVESGLMTVAWPLAFFDKTADGSIPYAQMMEGITGEPFSAFSFYKGAKLVDLRFPKSLMDRFPKHNWPQRRVYAYLGLEDEPIIGTIVKPKSGLTPELFSNCVVEAAIAGARFTKADENMHLRLSEMGRYVGQVVQDLEAAGFDLGKEGAPRKGKRFLFAPHVTADPRSAMDYAKAAVDAGANALMFSPYFGGGFEMAAEMSHTFDVPVYAHTAGMNTYCGGISWGIDHSVMYRLAALYGSAFMQLTINDAYLRPDAIEKTLILDTLRRDYLVGEDGMTLVLAGGLSAKNLGRSMKEFGLKRCMTLAGTSVYSHPDGASSGVTALLLAYQAYQERGIVDVPGLTQYGMELGAGGVPLVRAMGV